MLRSYGKRAAPRVVAGRGALGHVLVPVEYAAQPKPSRLRRTVLAGSAGAILLAAGLTWIQRRELASDLVDRRLAAAGVPASYRFTALGPSTQVIEDVRLGDPANPDLVARRVEVRWRYGLGLPVLAAIRIDGGRLRARWRDGRLSLGALDRLLPRSAGGGAMLPDLQVTLQDARVTLATPLGAVQAAIDGAGNAARAFHGLIRAEAPAPAIAGCSLGRMVARVSVATADAALHARGPVALRSTSCAAAALALDAGGAAIDLRLAPDFSTVRGTIALAGFAGRAGTARFGPLRGTIGLAGGRALTGTAALTLAGIVTPQARARSVAANGRYRFAAGQARFDGMIAARQLAAPPALATGLRSIAAAARATPLGPIAADLGLSLGRLLGGADIDAPVTAAIGPDRTLSIDRATIRAGGAPPATLSATFVAHAGGWRASGQFAGAGLPRIDARADAHGAIETVLRIAPYRVAGAALALAPIRLASSNGTTRFATVATLDGPLAGGSIEGLAVPLAGTFDRTRGLTIGEGCSTVGFTRVALAGTMLDPARITVCGSPIVSRSPAGVVRIAATAHDVALGGRSGAAPLALRAATLRLDAASFAAERLAVTLGAPDDPTRLDIAALEGRFASDRVGGTFAGAAGAIGHVPLALGGASGDWRLAGGALRLTGALQVADRAAAPRFLPLAAKDVALDLVDGRIAATANLRAPNREPTLARVALRHDLASGAGGAVLDVPGITFARGGLQPEMLTPLTLGVVANVAGTIAGSGRIDWTAAGVTSSGAFVTERLDLAAAFGPVAGLSGTIRFTDLLGLVTAPHQEARIAEINPGVVVANGVAHYRLVGGDRLLVEDARWPFAGGTLALDPATLDFAQAAERRLTFRIAGLDAAAFVQQLDFPNIAATGTFDGRLPMVFDQSGGRIDDGALTARGPGTLAYVGELSNAELGTMGKLAFDALKAIRYSGLDIALGGRLDGEIVTRVRFDGVRQATGDRSLVARMIRNLPFRFNIQIRAPFRGLVGSARSYVNPALLLQSGTPAAVQPADSAPLR